MRWLLLVLTFAWVVLVPAPALSRPGPSTAGAQYDQYVDQDSALGGRAAHDAIRAWSAIQSTSEEAQATERNPASAAELPSSSSELDVDSTEEGNTTEAQGESSTSADLEELPETGGPSPLWFGVPLVCIGGLLARRIFSP